MVHAYKASFEYLEGTTVRSTEILYTADTIAEAINAPIRFWDNRNATMPEFFTEMLYIEINPYEIGPINEKGSIGSRMGFRLMEWSEDRAMGTALKEYAEYMVQKLSR